MDDALVPEIWQYFLPPVGRIRCLNLRETFWDLKLDLQSFVTAGTRMLLFGSKEGHDDEAEVEDNIVRRLPRWDVAIEISGMSGHGESTAAQDNNKPDTRPKRKGVPKVLFVHFLRRETYPTLLFQPAAKHKAPAKPRGEVSDRAAILDRQVAVLPDRSGSSSMNFLSSSDFLIPPPWTSNILNASFVSYGHTTEGWRGKLRGKQSRHLVSDARQALYETLMQDSSDARQGLLLAMQRSNARKSARTRLQEGEDDNFLQVFCLPENCRR
jgi:hypothetical protein